MSRYHLRRESTGELPWVDRATLEDAQRALDAFRVPLGKGYEGTGFYLWDSVKGERVPERLCFRLEGDE